MQKPNRTLLIYIDISVIGGCFDSEFAKWSDGLIQDFRIGSFKPLLSEIMMSMNGK